MSDTQVITRGRYVKAKELARYEAADKFARFFQWMIQLGLVNTIDINTDEGKETRRWICEHLEPWEDIVFPPKESKRQ